MDVDHTDTKAKVGYQFGVVGEYGLSNNFVLQGNLLFTSKGFKTKESGVWDINGDGLDDEGTLRLTWNALYLKMPIMIGYKVDVTENFKINFAAGPYIAYGVGGKITGEIDARFQYPTETEHVKEKDKTNTFSDESIKRFDAGITGVVAAEYNQFILSVGYEYGLTDISQGMNSIHNRNAFVTLGYKFF